MERKKISIVVPVYNEETIIAELRSRFDALLQLLRQRFSLNAGDIEVLLVNDGSRDETLDRLRHNFSVEPYVVVNLSRNYGHQLAITAGIDQTKGDAVVLIDGDLQDPPEFIADLYGKFLEGYDVVYAVRKTREGESWFKLATAALFYRMMRKMTNIDLPLNAGDFRIMSRRVADVLSSMRETDRFIRGLTSWIGFKQTGLEYDRKERFAGKTKYPLLKMLKFSVDGITSFSGMPLRMVSFFGFCAAGAGFLYGLIVVYLKFFTERTVVGWSSIVVITLFMGGIQLIAIGVIGEYLKRVSDQVKQRPLYVIESVSRSRAPSA